MEAVNPWVLVALIVGVVLLRFALRLRVDRRRWRAQGWGESAVRRWTLLSVVVGVAALAVGIAWGTFR